MLRALRRALSVVRGLGIESSLWYKGAEYGVLLVERRLC